MSYVNIIGIIEEYDNGHTHEFNPNEYMVVKREDILKLYNKVESDDWTDNFYRQNLERKT